MENAVKLPLEKGGKQKYSGALTAYDWECFNASGQAVITLALLFGTVTVPPVTLILAMTASLALHNFVFTCF